MLIKRALYSSAKPSAAGVFQKQALLKFSLASFKLHLLQTATFYVQDATMIATTTTKHLLASS
jgi:hypothetical protein